MSNLYALDETLDMLNETNIFSIDILIESLYKDTLEFDSITESIILNEKVDIKATISKAWNTVKEFFKKIISAIRSFGVKIKNFLASISDKIRPNYYDEWDDDWEDFELDWEDDFFNEATEESVLKIVKQHKHIALPMLTKTIDLNNFSKVERYISEVEVNKRASSDVTHHGNVVLSRNKENNSVDVGTTICGGKVKTIIFDNDDARSVLSGADNVSESINKYCDNNAWVKAYKLSTVKNLYTYCREILKYCETKTLVDYLNKMTSHVEKLNKIIDTKFGLISKMIADHNEEKYKDKDYMPTNLLQAFRHTSEFLNSDIATINTLINASIQKTKDAAYIAGYIQAQNKN